MKKNLGIKVLCAVMISTVAVILISTRQPNKVEKPEVDSINTSINSQLNDNIRDVLARLIETEKKVKSIERRNKESAQKEPEQTSDLQSSIEALKQELSALKNHKRHH